MSNLQGKPLSILQGLTARLQGFSLDDEETSRPVYIDCLSGNVFIARSASDSAAEDMIKKYNTSGVYSGVSFGNSSSGVNRFDVKDLYSEGSLLYVSHKQNIKVFDFSGNLSTTITPALSPAPPSYVWDINSLCIIGSTMYFVSGGSGTLGTQGVWSMAKTGGTASRIRVALSKQANKITTDGTYLYVYYQGNFVSKEKLQTDGTVLSTLTDTGVTRTFDIDFFSGALFASRVGVESNTVQVYDASLSPSFTFGGTGSGDGQFNAVYGVSNYSSELYCVDYDNRRVQVFDSSGNFIRKFSV